jgi:hypothetical protein
MPSTFWRGTLHQWTPFLNKDECFYVYSLQVGGMLHPCKITCRKFVVTCKIIVKRDVRCPDTILMLPNNRLLLYYAHLGPLIVSGHPKMIWIDHDRGWNWASKKKVSFVIRHCLKARKNCALLCKPSKSRGAALFGEFSKLRGKKFENFFCHFLFPTQFKLLLLLLFWQKNSPIFWTHKIGGKFPTKVMSKNTTHYYCKKVV